MSRSRRYYSRIPLWISVILMILLLMSNQKLCGALINRGLLLSASKVLPAVFPYTVFTSILAKSGLSSVFGGKRSLLLARPFGLTAECIPALLMGLLAGFPIGALMTAEIYRKGHCTKTQAEHLASICNFCAPPFVLGVFGGGVMGGLRFGLLLFCVQTVLLVLYGILNAPRADRFLEDSRRKEGARRQKDIPFEEEQSPSLFSLLGRCVAEGALKTVQVVGYVLIFSLIAGMLAHLAGRFFLKNDALLSLFYGFFEFSSGITSLKEANMISLFCGSLVIGWSGLSVHMQVAGFLNEAGLSAKRNLLTHFFLAPAVAVITVALSKLFGLL